MAQDAATLLYIGEGAICSWNAKIKEKGHAAKKNVRDGNSKKPESGKHFS